MTAAFLLRLTMQGLLETAGRGKMTLAEEIAWPESLAGTAAYAVERLGDGPLCLQEVLATALLLHRPPASPKHLLQTTLRLGLMAVALREHLAASPGAKERRSLRIGFDLLSEGRTTIGVTGNPPRNLVLSLVKKIDDDPDSVAQVLSLGDWVRTENGYVPFACTSGEAELVISSGNIGLLLCGPDIEPSVLELCRKLDVPFVLANDPGCSPDEILRLARMPGRNVRFAVKGDPSLAGEGTLSAWQVQEDLSRPDRKVALIGGVDDLRQPMGYLPLELTLALRGRGFSVGGWGDAALWMTRSGLASAAQENPVGVLDNDRGPLSVCAALAVAGKLDNLQGICITGVQSCADLAFALGLSALGLRVCVATPLPVWGSDRVRCLLVEMLAGQGGELAHFDHPAQVAELVQWFTTEQG
jgi:hypothetical protein